MPRQRRRRRRSPSPTRTQASASPGSLRAAVVGRPWWLPTLGIVTAFFTGLWLGGTLSLSDTATSVALIGGAIGTGVGFARLLGLRLRARKLQQLRQRRADQDATDDLTDDDARAANSPEPDDDLSDPALHAG